MKLVLERRVRAFVGERRTVDSPLMYAKAAALLGASVLSYWYLVFAADTVAQGLISGFVLALALVGIGFNVQHDGNHGTFSRKPWVNRAAGLTLDLMGASSYFWKDKHNHNHHVYTNIPHEDADIDLGFLARLNGDHRWHWWHRYQHVYLWFLYMFVHLRYLYSDLQRMALGKKDGLTAIYPKGMDLVALFACKAFFLTMAFVVPVMMGDHKWTRVLWVYCVISMVMGLIFSVVFQLAHTVDVVEHPTTGELPDRPEWVIHQIATTANFAPRSRFLTFVLGGLNFQREHHLFPKFAHVHYPGISRVVKEVCREYGVPVRENTTLMDAMRSHYRFVREMGRKPSTNAGSSAEAAPAA